MTQWDRVLTGNFGLLIRPNLFPIMTGVRGMPVGVISEELALREEGHLSKGGQESDGSRRSRASRQMAQLIESPGDPFEFHYLFTPINQTESFHLGGNHFRKVENTCLSPLGHTVLEAKNTNQITARNIAVDVVLHLMTS